VRKAIEFAKCFLKLVSSNPLLLLDNRFLGAVPRAFESWPEPTQRFLNPPNIFPVKNLSFEMRTRHYLKLARVYLAGFQKLFANSKSFHTKWRRIY
jgi:hypothetical protein